MSKRKPPLDEKALAFFRWAGRKGGKRRLETMTPEERSESARRARLLGGGRRRTVDRARVLGLRAEGKTLAEVAAAAHCSVSTAALIIAESQGKRWKRMRT